MTLQPLNDNVLIERNSNETKTPSGLIIPPTAQEKQTLGTVLAVGPGTKDITMSVQKGQTVLMGKYTGVEVELDGKKLVIIKQADILGVVV
jgi:chaperonin GroES